MHLTRVGNGYLLTADAPALLAGFLYFVGVRPNHVFAIRRKAAGG